MTASPARLGIFGAEGRMGRHIRASLDAHPSLQLVAAVSRGSDADLAGCDVVIDVSVAFATSELLRRLDGSRAALVTAVTGRDEAQQTAIRAHADRAPLFTAANFSVGVAVMTRLVAEASRAMGGEVEVFELHHREKADAPSGTALQLARVAAEAQGRSWPEARAAVRDGHTGPRASGQIGLAALRGGLVPGEHTVFVFGESERIEVTHRASDRAVFAHGALRAAAWVVGRPAGSYSMTDLLDNSR